MAEFLLAQSTEIYKPSRDLVAKEIKKSITISEDLKVIDIPFVYATETTLQGFGRIVKNFDEAKVQVVQWPCKGRKIINGNLGGIAEGTFRCYWQEDKCLVVNEAVAGLYLVGIRQGDDILTTYANYHPDGSQIFYNSDHTPFIIILAKPCPDELIKPSDFVAFYCDGKDGIELNVGTWHQANFPVNTNEQVRLRNKQGKIHGVVEVVFDKEFGLQLRVQGALSRVPTTNVDLIPQGYQEESKSKHDLNGISKSIPSKKRKIDGDALPNVLTGNVVPASKESIAPFGELISAYDECQIDIVPWPRKSRQMLYANEAGIAESSFTLHWKDQHLNVKESGVAAGIILQPDDTETCYRFSNVMMHPDGSKIIYPLDTKPFAILLSDKSEEEIGPADFSIFQFPSGVGLHLKPNIWHSYPMPLDGEGKFQVRQSAVGAVVEIDMEEEFQTFVRCCLK